MKKIDLIEMLKLILSKDLIEKSLGYLLLSLHESNLKHNAGVDWRWIEIPKHDGEPYVPRESVPDFSIERKKYKYYNALAES